MAGQNLIIELLIRARDQASSVIGNVFGFLDRTTSATANAIRETFSNVFGGAVESAADFEAQLDRVQVKGGYNAETIQKIKNAARDLGIQFGITGTEAAQGFEVLAAAGLSAEDAVGALPSVLALAKSEQIAASAAAEKLVDSLSVMGLGFEEAGRMADVLAKGADITTSSSAQLADAVSEAGGSAKAFGLDLEKTVALLDLLHKNGIKGSKAGTALKGILTQLLDPTSKASKALRELGIESNDLGIVLDGLKAAGERGKTAVLAFGQEAGPGLYALLNEGSAGVEDFTAKLRAADGQALKAAEGMGGNLNAAMSALESAWDSLKSALIDPVLEPIAAQVKDLTKSFQASLSDGSIKGLQELIGEFGRNSAQAIGDFIRSFDFKSAIARSNAFAKEIKNNFDTVKIAGAKAADVIKLAWNGLQIVFNTTVGGLQAVVASFYQTLANLEEAASKIGLVTVKRASELQARAQDWMQRSKESLEAIKRDASDAGEAFNSLVGKTDAVTDAQKKLADQIPENAVALEKISRSIDDYAAMLGRAEKEQYAAAQAAEAAEASYLKIASAYHNGTKTLDTYEQAAAKQRDTQERLKETTQTLETAQENYTRALQDHALDVPKLTQAEAQYAATQTRLAPLLEATATANLKSAQEKKKHTETALALARAEGNESAARQLLIQLNEAELNVLRKTLAQKNLEAQKANEALANIQKDIQKRHEKGEAISEIIRLQLQEAETAVQASVQQVEVAEKNVEIQQKKVETTKEGTQETGKNTQATKENTQATNEGTVAYDKNNEKIVDSTSLTQVMVEHLGNARKATAALSEATAALFEKNLWKMNAREVGVATGEIRKMVATLDTVEDKYAGLTQKIAEMGAASKQASQDILFGANSVERFFAYVDKANADAQKAFYEQSLAAERLADELENLGGSGVNSLNLIKRATRQLDGEFSLLDEQDLSRLRSALDSANAKLKQMQDNARSARQELAEIDAEIAEAKGDTAAANKIRLQLEETQRLAEVEERLKQARIENNREAIAALEEQKRKLQTLYKLKEDNLKNDNSQRQSTRQLTDDMNDLADATDRAHKGVSQLNNLDLSALNGQVGQLGSKFLDINRIIGTP